MKTNVHRIKTTEGITYVRVISSFQRQLVLSIETSSSLVSLDHPSWHTRLFGLIPGKIMGHYDKIDRKKHREVLGDIACSWGDIPPGLLASGTPDQVRDYVKELIDDFPDGGLIVDGSANGFPIESRKENMMAVVETVQDCGRY